MQHNRQICGRIRAPKQHRKSRSHIARVETPPAFRISCPTKAMHTRVFFSSSTLRGIPAGKPFQTIAVWIITGHSLYYLRSTGEFSRPIFTDKLHEHEPYLLHGYAQKRRASTSDRDNTVSSCCIVTLPSGCRFSRFYPSNALLWQILLQRAPVSKRCSCITYVTS